MNWVEVYFFSDLQRQRSNLAIGNVLAWLVGDYVTYICAETVVCPVFPPPPRTPKVSIKASLALVNIFQGKALKAVSKAGY